jgi:arylsulfatase A-like enzyme
MGLIKQIDDQLGLLFAMLKAEGLDQSTMIVFTSDHGDYLGDHWMGLLDALSGWFWAAERSECGLILMAERSPS